MSQPLADRMRPKNMDDIVGQKHLFGERGLIRRMLAGGRMSNMIFYGPPGTGKTTAASIIAAGSGMELYRLNATTASLSDVKEIAAATKTMFGAGGVLLYLDEIQYFNKKQQQSLLEYLEDGRITMIASTTENPYFCVYSAIISRSSVFEFRPVAPEDCLPALHKGLAALNADRENPKTAEEAALTRIAQNSAGDVRRALGLLEALYDLADDVLTEEDAVSLTPATAGNFDTAGDVHYDLLSALQKSIRGSDPDAALFYLARLLAGGDLLSPCRRLLVIANEDIGAAYPLAAAITYACVESAKQLGLPEAALPLSNAVVMLATAPKSNSAYTAYHLAAKDAQNGLGSELPEHLRSPLFKGYRYPHDYPGHYVKQQYLPNDLKDRHYYVFGDNKTEQLAKSYFEQMKKMASEHR